MMINDVDIYYQVAGSGDPLLLLHGLGSSSAAWQLQRESFSPDYKLILVDCRGHGRSGKPPGPYTMSLLADDTIKLLDALDVPAVHVVGLSLGGMIGFQMAVNHPQRLLSLTAVNTGPEVVPRTIKERLAIWQRKLLVNIFSMEQIAQSIGNGLFPEPEQAELRQMFIDGFAANDKAAYKATTGAILGWSVCHRLGEIQCPVLMISSDQDYTPVSAKERYLAEMPDARLVVINNSRHAVPIDQPEAFNATVREFLTSVNG